MKKLALSLLTAGLLVFGAATSSVAAESTAPKSVIHVVTVAFKPEATPEKIKAALDGVKALPASYKGITRVWTKAIGDIQNPPGATIPKTHVIVMEFADQAALTAYTDSEAQKKWYESYLPIRLQSTTFDVTN